MCGGHGIHHLTSLVTAQINAQSKDEQHYARTDSPRFDAENEVKLMFARGEIGTEAFQRLLVMAHGGELDIQDFKRLRASHAYEPGRGKQARKQADEHAVAFMRKLQMEHRQLEAAYVETEESLHRLQLEVVSLYQQAESGELSQEQRNETLSRARSAEQRSLLVRERLDHIRINMADVATQQHRLEFNAGQ